MSEALEGQGSAAAAARLLASDLRRQIVTGELAEGTRLPAEPELQRRFEVSRATLRSAFRVLEAEGLIRIHRGARGGAEVIHPSAETAARYFSLVLQSQGTTIDDFVYARNALEPPIAALTVKNANTENVARLRAAVAAEDRVLAINDTQAYLAATVRFHGLLAELSGSSTLWVVMDLLDGVLHRYAEDRLRAGHEHPEMIKGHRAHAALVDLIEQGDVEGARELWTRHVQQLGAALLKVSGRGRSNPMFT